MLSNNLLSPSSSFSYHAQAMNSRLVVVVFVAFLIIQCVSLVDAFVIFPGPTGVVWNGRPHVAAGCCCGGGAASAVGRYGSSSSLLHGIMEWRDHDFGLPGSSSSGNNKNIGGDQNRGPPKSICLLPFPYQEVLLQGETKELRLYEERFLQLFRDVMDNHDGIVAMALLANSGLIQTVPLCEVEAYTKQVEGFGIFATIRCVGRAQLLEVSSSSEAQPYLKGSCIEITDSIPPNLELPNLLAGNIENAMLLLSSMEHRLSQADNNSNKGGSTREPQQQVTDKDMKRRMAVARLEDTFYNDQDSNDEEDEEEDDDEDDEDPFKDRLSRFRHAYEVALSTDTQGYKVSKSDLDREETLSPMELTATSWAAFCTEHTPRNDNNNEDATFRIQAMDADSLFERLKLASQMLQRKKATLRVKLQKAGLQFRGDDDDNDSSEDKNSSSSSD